MRRTIISLIAATLLGGGFVAATPTSASAAGFDLYDISAADFRVNTGNCRYITVTARSAADGRIEDVDASVDVWRGGQSIGSVSLSSAAGDPTRLSGEYFYCPDNDELGTFRLGPSRVTYWDYDYNDYKFVDDTTGSMKILQVSSLKNFAVKKKGNKKTFTVRGTFFNCGYESRYQSIPKGAKIVLQRQASNGSWKYVKSAKVGKNKKATFVVKFSKKAKYRATFPETTKTWGSTSRTLAK
jgi:hypothetical protein